MISGEQLFEALKAISDDSNVNDNNQTNDIKKIESENDQLQQKKTELFTNLNRPSAVGSSLILLKDMIIQQKNFNQLQLEFKQISTEQFKNRSLETKAETFSWKQKLNDSDNSMTLPYHDVLDKIMEFEEKIAENRSASEKLIVQLPNLIQILQNESEEGAHIRFIDTLKCIAEERSKLIEMLQKSSHINETNE